MQHDEFDTAKQQELQSWKDHYVYESVPFEKQRCISVRWVCSLKTTESGIKPKARLVARGFEEQSDSIEKESPTCSKDAMRTMLSLINKNGWKLSSLDIKTAFLQGEKIDRDVYLRPPKEAKCDPGIVWKLHKCVYGLPDASLKWYEKVRKSMEALNGKMSVLDNALFMWHKNGVLIGMVAVHVEDFLCAGNDMFLKKVKPCLGDTFSVGKEEATTFRYIGLHLDQTENSLFIHQKSYVSSLEPLEFTDVRFEERSLTLDERNTLRSKVGQLLWLSNQTKPDICFETSTIAGNINNATTKDYALFNKVVRKLKKNSYTIKFTKLVGDIHIVLYVDAAFGNLADGGSQGGYLVFLADQHNNCNLISWQSKRLKRIVRSTLAAETLAMCEGVDAALYVSAVYSDMAYNDSSRKLPLQVLTDNKSLQDALKSSKYVSDRRLRIDIGSLKELIDYEHMQICWVPTDEQLADVLTKTGVNADKLINTLLTGRLPRLK